MTIISLDSRRRPDSINVRDVRGDSIRKISSSLLKPATEQTYVDLAPEHASDPIKSMDDIMRISRFLIGSGRYRDNMLFIVGINFGLRASDLRLLRFSNLITENNMFKDTFPVFEKKTRNTRKRKKNRYITINRAVMEAVLLYLEHTDDVSLSDYLFKSESRNSRNRIEPMTVRSIERVLKGIAKDLNLNMHVATHTLRKTFCYHQMLMSHNDNRKLLLLQKMLGHSSPAQTLDYIGITQEEIEEAYRNLNLGSESYNYLIDSDIAEREVS